jgi:HTH-like domain
MRFRLIEAERAQHPVSRLCKVLGVTSAGYYAWRRGPSLRLLGDAELQRLIVSIYDGSLQTYGAPRIHAELADEHGIRVGRKAGRAVDVRARDRRTADAGTGPSATKAPTGSRKRCAEKQKKI